LLVITTKMNASQPSLRAVPTGSVAWKITATGPYGLRDPIIDGLSRHANDLKFNRHPIEFSEKMFHENQERNDMLMLRNHQGLHAPLRLKLERRIASKVQRLPCLASSHLMSDILTGRLDTIEFDDILNDPMDAEVAGQPHVLMERRAGI